MNNAWKRTANTLTPQINGTSMPVLDDSTLLKLILALPLGDTARADMEKLHAKVEPGKFGQLKRNDRDRLLKFAHQNGALPKPKKVKRPADTHAPDVYDDRETRGTAVAAAIIAAQVPLYGGEMPWPPGRPGKPEKKPESAEGKAA